LEVNFVRKRIVLASLLAAFLVATLTVAIFASANPAPAPSDMIVSHVEGGVVNLALPAGNFSHPTDLRIAVSDVSNESDYGGTNVLEILTWAPAMNTYIPVAVLSTNTNESAIEWIHEVLNGTPIWRPPTMQNYFTPTSEQLQVWMDDDGVVMVNSTESYNVTLPDTLGGNFTLPPMTLMFRPIASGFAHNEVLLLPQPMYSGWMMNMTHTDVPAWVRAEIPLWLGNTPVENVGTIIADGTTTYTPPET
jgi:hypothetical protein